jgi:hypothetical protein
MLCYKVPSLTVDAHDEHSRPRPNNPGSLFEKITIRELIRMDMLRQKLPCQLIALLVCML